MHIVRIQLERRRQLKSFEQVETFPMEEQETVFQIHFFAILYPVTKEEVKIDLGQENRIYSDCQAGLKVILGAMANTALLQEFTRAVGQNYGIQTQIRIWKEYLEKLFQNQRDNTFELEEQVTD